MLNKKKYLVVLIFSIFLFGFFSIVNVQAQSCNSASECGTGYCEGPNMTASCIAGWDSYGTSFLISGRCVKPAACSTTCLVSGGTQQLPVCSNNTCSTYNSGQTCGSGYYPYGCSMLVDATGECGTGGTGGGGGGTTDYCGSVNKTTVPSIPTTNLCSGGATASGVFGAGPWTWTCIGANNNSSCSANSSASYLSLTVTPSSLSRIIGGTYSYDVTVTALPGFNANWSNPFIYMRAIGAPGPTGTCQTVSCSTGGSFVCNSPNLAWPYFAYYSLTDGQTLTCTYSGTASPAGTYNPITIFLTDYVNNVKDSANVALTVNPVTVSVFANTPYYTTPSTNVYFTYVPTTNTGSTECRLLDNTGVNPLTSYQASSPIVYASPNGVGSYGYYVQCRNTTTQTAMAISNPIIVITACNAGSDFVSGSCHARLTITASSGANGTITPAGATSVVYGSNQTYTITPSGGYNIVSVLKDGVSVGAVGTYTFSNITTNHTISATFTAAVVNGACSATINTCNAGTFSDTADGVCTNNWDCLGSGTGSNVSCSTNKANGTACTSDSNTCTNDVCSTGVCSHPAVSGSHLDCLSNSCTSVANTSSTCSNQSTCTAVGQVCGITTPTTPNGLSVSASTCGNNWLNISWNASAGATSYEVYRDGGATPITLAGYSCNATSCSGSDTGLALGSTHSYKVLARNAAGPSALSGVQNGTVAITCAPTDVTFSCPSPGTNVHLTWTAAPNIDYYLVRVDNQSNGWNNGCLPSVNPGDHCDDSEHVTNTFYDFSSQSGASYNVWVFASKNSTFSAQTYISPIPQTCANVSIPPTPTGLSVSASTCDNNWLNLSWNVSSGATSYEVYRDGGATPITLAGYSCNATSCSGSDTGLALGSTHSYKVRATNGSGSSSQSAAVSNMVALACGCSKVGTATITPNPVISSNTFLLSCTWSAGLPPVAVISGCSYTGVNNDFNCLTGSSTIFPIGGPYTVTCQPNADPSYCPISAQVVVSPAATATASISAASTNIPYNTSTNLNWSYSNATSCTITPPATISGYPSGSGTVSTGNLAVGRTYSISCNPVGPNSSKSVTVNVTGGSNTLTVIKSGQGTVTSNPAGINCGIDCSESYPSGTVVTLTEAPATGRVFTGWSSSSGLTCDEGDKKHSTCTFTLNSGMSVIANFMVDPNYKEF